MRAAAQAAAASPVLTRGACRSGDEARLLRMLRTLRNLVGEPQSAAFSSTLAAALPATCDALCVQASGADSR